MLEGFGERKQTFSASAVELVFMAINQLAWVVSHHHLWRVLLESIVYVMARSLRIVF